MHSRETFRVFVSCFFFVAYPVQYMLWWSWCWNVSCSFLCKLTSQRNVLCMFSWSSFISLIHLEKFFWYSSCFVHKCVPFALLGTICTSTLWCLVWLWTSYWKTKEKTYEFCICVCLSINQIDSKWHCQIRDRAASFAVIALCTQFSFTRDSANL